MRLFTVHSDIGGNFNVYDLFAQKEKLVDDIVNESIRAMTQTYIDMILEEQMDSRTDILEKLGGVHASAIEYMNCVMNDLHKIVQNKMEKSTVEFVVNYIQYDDSNNELSDVGVNIKVSEKA